MARGRFLSDSVAKDRRLNDLSVEAALVYLMTIPHLDRDGIIDGDAPVLWGTVCPRRRALLDLMDAIIAEWVACGLVVLYDTDNGGAIWFCGFQRNQQGMHYDREAKSKFPPPPGHIRTDACIIPEPESPSDTLDSDEPEPNPDKLWTNSGQSPAEVKVEVKDQDQPKEKEDDDERAPDPATAAVFTAWDENIPGTMTDILKDHLLALLDECGEPAVLHGITASVTAGARNFNYIAKCARNHAAGVDVTPEDARRNGRKPIFTEPSLEQRKGYLVTS